MAKDPETGVDPVAKDADVDDLEAERRRRRAKGGAGDSIRERAANGDGKDEPGDVEEGDGQFAMGLIESEMPVSLSRLIPRGMPLEVTVAMSQAEVPGKGLFGIDEDVTLVVRCRPGKYEQVPTRGEADKTERMKFRQRLRVMYVARAGTDSARSMVAEAESKGARRAAAG